MKKIVVSLLAAGALLCMTPMGFAVSDLDGHWSKPYIESLHDDGVINPSETGAYSPDKAITRAEFMRYINRALGFKQTTSISFTDVPQNAWYYETVQIAVNYGYIDGMGNNKMSPEATLTREQAATILGRLHKYTSTSSVNDLTFNDTNKISDWSKAYIAEAVAQGYLAGYNDGTLKPQGEITRGEIAKILYYFVGTPLNEQNGAFDASSLNTDVKNLTIGAGCTLSDVKVAGNLYITEGASGSTVTLDDVTVNGQVIVSGGNVIMEDVNAAKVTVASPMKVSPTLTLKGNTSVAQTDVLTAGSLGESELATSAGGFANITLNGENIEVDLDASDLWNLTVLKRAVVNASERTVVDLLTAKAPLTYLGGKSIAQADIQAAGTNISEIKPDKITVASGITATVKGETVQSEYQVMISPATLSISLLDRDAISHSYDMKFSGDFGEVGSLTCDGNRMVLGTDYVAMNGNTGVRVYKTFIEKLSAGSHRVELVMDNKSKGYFTIEVTDSGNMSVSPQTFTFDMYEKSSNYVDMSCVVTIPKGTSLSSVMVGSKTLDRGTDYSYNTANGSVIIFKEVLATNKVGTHTVTFKCAGGATATNKVVIVNTKPVNKLDLTSIDFDANTTSGGYQDVTVKLSTADGATLKKIRCAGTDLELDWQYKVSGDNITISKGAITKLKDKSDEYLDFVFVMSSGESPTLRVNFVTTYSWTIQVTDDLDVGLQGIQVDVTPLDTETGTAAQTLKTDKDGKAVVNVKKGKYKVVASSSTIKESVMDNEVNVTMPKTTTLKAKVLETLTLTVVNSFGAKLDGATVIINGETKTAGSDGVVTFTLPRGEYSAQISRSGYVTQVKSYKLSESVKDRVILQ